jgi:hypothetical protein
VNVAKSLKFMNQVYTILSTSKKSPELKITLYEVVSNLMSPLAGTQFTKTVDYKEWNEQVLKFLQLMKNKIKPKYQLVSFLFLKDSFLSLLIHSFQLFYASVMKIHI